MNEGLITEPRPAKMRYTAKIDYQLMDGYESSELTAALRKAYLQKHPMSESERIRRPPVTDLHLFFSCTTREVLGFFEDGEHVWLSDDLKRNFFKREGTKEA